MKTFNGIAPGLLGILHGLAFRRLAEWQRPANSARKPATIDIQCFAAPRFLQPFLDKNGYTAAGGFALADCFACAKPQAALPLSFVESWA